MTKLIKRQTKANPFKLQLKEITNQGWENLWLDDKTKRFWNIQK